ncbi:MAG: 50S ribosomal protein L2 [candidate division WS6 bacterium 34_10]|uniref:50S ribosomal protein L2 n=1 Tax=candidate division WS6 bacterium 34_10 TaxID=1641389 RepID=A0A117M0G2_9BACT|nr:MAG: 50S ribosomal protein L2 [candidate division WS6 bacterium 34_10]
MAIKTYKPKTSTLRATKLEDRSHLEKDSGPRKLTVAKNQKAGRNNQGKITVRHRGGGFKRRVRKVDFKREKFDIPAKVLGFYFDPNRSAHLALLQYEDGEKRYIIAPKRLKVGDTVVSSEKADILVGNAMQIKNIPSGTLVHCVENEVGRGAKFARSAGQAVTVQGIDPSGKYVQIKMPSSEIRLVPAEALATIGQVGNEERVNVNYGKAGRRRNLGWRPTVRGMAMHAVQHPHGGGEGKGQVGGQAKDIWGNRIGTKTRKNKRTDKYIVKRRKVKRQPDSKK